MSKSAGAASETVGPQRQVFCDFKSARRDDEPFILSQNTCQKLYQNKYMSEILQRIEENTKPAPEGS